MCWGRGAEKVVIIKEENTSQILIENGKGENVFDIQKLKDLKINGKIGCLGEKDKLSYKLVISNF